jgi:hypothetical protein
MVSVLRGDRTTYRAAIGLDARARDRRRETSFCTHTVSTGAPMVVQNAAEEPFFQGTALVRRDGIKAYVGVPLRTSRGVLTGNVCAMDYVPRRIDGEMVRLLELYAEPIVAEIERGRTGRAGGHPPTPCPRTAAGTPLHPARWFQDLASLAEGSLAAGSPSMLVAHGPGAEILADHGGLDEPAGWLAGDQVGLLLVGPHDPEARLVEHPAFGALERRSGGAPKIEVFRPPFAKLFR